MSDKKDFTRVAIGWLLLLAVVLMCVTMALISAANYERIRTEKTAQEANIANKKSAEKSREASQANIEYVRDARKNIVKLLDEPAPRKVKP